MDNNEYTCKDCFLQRSGYCFGKLKICNQFDYAPTIDEETKSNWPTVGDATFIRQNGRRKNINGE